MQAICASGGKTDVDLYPEGDGVVGTGVREVPVCSFLYDSLQQGALELGRDCADHLLRRGGRRVHFLPSG